MKSQRQTILLVDDDDNDRFLNERALKEIGTGCVVHALPNGDAAIAYLKGLGEYRDRTRFQFPGYIITDLKMTAGDGFDILNFLKHNPQLSVIPVVIFSASGDTDDIRRAYALGASAYLVKDHNSEKRLMKLRKLYEFFSECEVPEVNEAGHEIPTISQGKLGERFSE